MSTETVNNFERASRLKLRFSTNRGQSLAVEDLWGLPLEDLDKAAVAVNEDLQKETKKSFLPNKNRVETHNALRLEILTHIMGVRLAEDDARKLKAEYRAQLATLEEIAASKTGEAFKSMSLEDVNKQIAELKAKAAA